MDGLVIFFCGFVVGSICFDVLWRILYRKTKELVDEQRAFIRKLTSD